MVKLGRRFTVLWEQERRAQRKKQHFNLDKVGELKEYVGCKVEYIKIKGQMKLTQPVLIQSFADKFGLPTKEFTTPMAPGQVLVGKGAPI